MKKAILTAFACLTLLFSTNNQAKADSSEQYYDYNIFSATTWTLSPYVFFGYGLSYSSHKNQTSFVDENGNAYGLNYQYMMKNLHNGFKTGAGVTINRNWSFELSVMYVQQTSSLGSKYHSDANLSNIDDITSRITILGIDMYMRLPFDMIRNKFALYLTGGMNVVVGSVNKSYKDPQATVPAWVAKELQKTSFGLNAGIAVDYNLTDHIYFRTDIRRLWLLSNALIRDSWLFNLTAGVKF